MGGCILVYSSLISIVKLKCFTTKNVWWFGGFFLIYSPLIQSDWEAAFEIIHY